MVEIVILGGGPGQDISIEFHDTSSIEENNISWIEVNLTIDQSTSLGLTLPAGKMYISDRVWVVDISWNKLNELNLISGKEITIDGKRYKVCSPTGGITDNNTNNMYSSIILNNFGLDGIPIITSSNSYKENLKWNIPNMGTICQERCEPYASYGMDYVTGRGYYRQDEWITLGASNSWGYFGFRPVLIPLDPQYELNILEFKTYPWESDSMPVGINVELYGSFFQGYQEFNDLCRVTNNALDETPVWEHYPNNLDLFNMNNPYIFTNTTKTAKNWATQVWITMPIDDISSMPNIAGIQADRLFEYPIEEHQKTYK